MRASPVRRRRKPRVAFVLGGGGHMGAYQVGMLRALLERGVVPDVVVGTSVGALNGAAVASDPRPDVVDRLEEEWLSMVKRGVFAGSLFAGAVNLFRTRTAMHSNGPLRELIERVIPASRFEDLRLPFQCVAASIEHAAEHWFTEGSLTDAILASSAIPGLLPTVEIDGQHFIDGGIVNSIPVGRAVDLGAREIYVLHVGRIERALDPPTNPWQVAMVAFEIARRHRFARDMATLPRGVTAHVLPTGERTPPRYDDLSQLRYRDFSQVERRIQQAHRATLAYLDDMGSP
jgi:NTE family protein